MSSPITINVCTLLLVISLFLGGGSSNITLAEPPSIISTLNSSLHVFHHGVKDNNGHVIKFGNETWKSSNETQGVGQESSTVASIVTFDECSSDGVNYKCKIDPGDMFLMPMGCYYYQLNEKNYIPSNTVASLTPVGTSDPDHATLSVTPNPTTLGDDISVEISENAALGERYQLNINISSPDPFCSLLAETINRTFQTYPLHLIVEPEDCEDCDNGNITNDTEPGGSAEHVGHENLIVIPGTGHVYSRVVDYDGPGLLKAIRYYNSSSSFSVLGMDFSAVLQAQYPHPFHYLFASLDGDEGVVTAINPRSSGSMEFTSEDGGETWQSESRYQISYLSTPNADGASWLLTGPDGSTTEYDGNLLPIRFTSLGGASLSYSVTTSETNTITTITDDFGRSLVYSIGTEVTNDPESGSVTSLRETITTPQNEQYAYSFGHDTNALTEVAFPDGNTRKFSYVASQTRTDVQLRSQVIDENANIHQTVRYDGLDRATSIESASGHNKHTVSYGSYQNGVWRHVTTDPLGTQRTLSFQINTLSKPILVGTSLPCDTCGRNIVSRTLGEEGLVVETQDARGAITTYDYDYTRKLPIRVESAAGTAAATTTTYVWNPTYRLPTQIDEPGRKTELSYDDAGNLRSRTVTDTAAGISRTWTYSDYTAWGEAQTIDGPRTDAADITHRSFYPIVPGDLDSGQLHTVTDPLGHVTTFEDYDGNGHPLKITDPNNSVTQFTYWPRGLLKRVQVGQAVTSFDYWPTGLLKKVSLPSGAWLDYAYDDAHRLTDVYDQLGNRIHYTLDEMGNRVKTDVYGSTGTLVRTGQTAYDALNRLRKIEGPMGQETLLGRDLSGNVTSITVQGTRTTHQQFDALDRLFDVTDAAGGVTRYDYDAQDHLVAVTDPRGLVTRYSIDGFGDVLQTDSPDTGITVSTFDAAGNTLSRRDAKGQTTTYRYDALGRLVNSTFDDGRATTYTYDQGPSGIGHLTTLQDDAGTTTWRYDAQGHVTQKTQTVDGIPLTTGYTYDTAGRLAGVTLPSGHVAGFQWDASHITEVTLDGQPLASAIAYQPFGGPDAWIFANGEQVTRTYDLSGRLVEHSLGQLTYDTGDRIIASTAGGYSILDTAETYDYDDLDRLIQVSGRTDPIDYLYDANGNRTEQGVGTALTRFDIDPASNRIVSAVTGDISNHRDHTFTYDTGGRLIAADGATYRYNDKGERVAKNVSGNTTLFAYDESGHLLGEYRGDGTPISEIIWLDDLPLAVVRPSGTFYIHADHLNTPRQIDDVQGRTVWVWDATPFGRGLPDENPSGLGAFAFNLRFAGQYYDQETGFHYNYFRDYDPTIGRYIQSDPIGLEGGINTYTYTENNPLRFTDPTGLCLEDACIVEGAIAISIGQAIVDALTVGVGAAAIMSGHDDDNVIPGPWPDSTSSDDTSDNPEQCPNDEQKKKEKNCLALYNATLQSCASIKNRRAQQRCYEAAKANYEACMSQD